MRRSIFMLALALLLGSAAAGTVTLTGSCVSRVLNGNTVQFGIINSGNDSAYSMLLAPVISGATPTSPIYNISALGPGEQKTINVTLENPLLRGAYVGYFIATYDQGAGSTFTAAFPCILYFYNTTISQILLSTNESLLSNGTVSVKVTATNAGSDAVNANVSIIVPPTLSQVSSPSFEVTLAPYATKTVTFYLTSLSTDQAAYGAAAAASYTAGGLGYAVLSKFVVSFEKTSSGGVGDLLVVAVIAVIIVLLALLAFVFLKNRRKASGVV